MPEHGDHASVPENDSAASVASRKEAAVTAIDLDALTLDTGSHSPDGDAMCVMEAVAFVAGEPWSDHPECASPVLGAFLRSWNDGLPDDDRQSLKQYIGRLVGSKGTPEQEAARAWMALDWLVRVYTPAWLRFSASTAPQFSAGLAVHADILAALPEFNAGMDVPSVRPAIDACRKDAAAARAAAGAALRPCVVEWQTAAHELVERMLAITEAP